MQRTAYVQVDENGQPYSAHGAVAAKGFALLGFDVRTFQSAALDQMAISVHDVVVGGMGTVRRALAHLGVRPPSLPSLPAALQPFAGRSSWRTTWQQLLADGRYPIFVKPDEDSKLFNGQVIKSEQDLRALLRPRSGFPVMTEDTRVLAQDAVQFVSEWRVFLIRGIIVGVSFYRGDPLIFPNAAAIRGAIAAHQQAPAGYSADFGVDSDGRTLLVETNDGYSLGHGGLPAGVYADLLLARWDEVTAATVID